MIWHNLADHHDDDQHDDDRGAVCGQGKARATNVFPISPYTHPYSNTHLYPHIPTYTHLYPPVSSNIQWVLPSQVP